jgi:general secretion pathway protein C
MAALELSSWPDSASQFLGRVTASPWTPIVVNVAALVLLVYGMAMWTLRVIAPPAPVQVSLPAPSQATLNLQPLLDAHIFGRVQTGPAGSVDPNQLPVSSLNIVLTGIMAQDKAGQAMMSVNGAPQAAFTINQEVLPGVTLHTIYADRVVLSRGATLEMVMLKDSDAKLPPGSIVRQEPQNNIPNPIQRTGESTFNVDRQALTRQVTQAPELLSQATVSPGRDGLVVRQVQSGSMFEKLGLRVGDVVRSINGNPVGNMGDLLKVYAQVTATPGSTPVSVELMRGGQTEVLEYQLQ